MVSKPLTQARIDALKAKAKPYKVFDGGGLHLLVTPNGSKLWRLAYRVSEKQKDGSSNTKQKTLALGIYNRERNGLTEARAASAAAKLTLKAGRDPARVTPVMDGRATFKAVALDWHAHNKHTWTPKYAAIVLTRLETFAFPAIGGLPLADVRRSDVGAVIKAIEDRGILDTAHRVKQYIGAVFRHSDDDDVRDPTPMLKGKLKKRNPVQHHKSLKAREVGPFLLKLDESECEPETRLAIMLTILTAARTMEVIGARWEEFERLTGPKRALWRIPKERMKKRREHLIPLSNQALAVLETLRPITGRSEYLFPSRLGSGHMSNNTMLFHCYALGYRNKTTMHGWRGTFSTIANESGLWAPDIIEMQLAHAEGDAVRAAYNSAEHLPKRRELMVWWGEQIEKARLRADLDERVLG